MYIARNENFCLLMDLPFLTHKKWSGGKARSMQLYELFQNAGYSIELLQDPKYPGKIRIGQLAIQSTLNFGYYRPLSIHGLRSAGNAAFLYSHYFSSIPGIDAILLEGTGFGALQAIAIAKAHKKIVISVPANLESLVNYGQVWTHRISIEKRLKEETRHLVKSDMVFCISLEETWLLQIFGIKAHFLPYFPCASVKVNQEAIARERTGSPKKGYLYFADFGNAPNRLGFEQFVAELKSGEIAFDDEIRVAGRQSEQYNALIDDIPGVVLSGELSADDLNKELIYCKAVILNHYPSSGMLTRVPELMLAGIPIFGNLEALKSYSMLSDLSPQEKTNMLRQLSVRQEQLFWKELQRFESTGKLNPKT